MKIKYLSVPILALLLLLVGCSNPSSDREEDNEKKEDKQEQKEKADKNEDKEKDDQEDQDTDSDEDSDTDEMTDDVSMDATDNTQEVADQAYDANYGVTNESAAPANDNYDDEKYQEYLSVKENSDGLREAERNNEVPEGAGGGGSSWSYVNENESYDEWVDRTTREKAAAGFSDDDYSSGY
ncbi:hypothetical protein [Staphylococcus sp. 11261D007BR]